MTGRTWFPNGLTGRHVLIAVIAFFGVMLVASLFAAYWQLGRAMRHYGIGDDEDAEFDSCHERFTPSSPGTGPGA